MSGQQTEKQIEQGWQTVSHNRTKKVKPEEPVKFDPIPARQREAQDKIKAQQEEKKQIKYTEQVNSNQDWQTVTITKTQPKPKVTLPQKPTSAIKFDESGDVVKTKKVSPQMAKAIVDARVAKKWTQVQLAHNSAIDVKTINEVERGGGLYDAGVFNKLTKTLGISIERNCVLEKKN